jgi:dienelactone hydrolase/Flp pilus assembly protein TadD
MPKPPLAGWFAAILLAAPALAGDPGPLPLGPEPPKAAPADGPAAQAPAKPEFETGKLIARVVTRHDGAQSYALYLPKAYTPDRKWPILYGFSPAAQGSDPVKLFMAAAEQHGWIVVGSNNAQNGPFEPIQAAIAAMLKDTAARLAVDEQRRYATGFSGGARVAFFLATDQGFAGAIPCGAGMSQGQKAPEKGGKLAVCGLVGSRDFNYLEMLRLEEGLKNLGLRQRLLVFDGEHRWPGPALCGAALRYLELLARLDAGKAAEKEAGAILEAEQADADKLLEAKGQYLRGYGRFEELARLLKDAEERKKPVLERIAAIEATERYQRERKAQADLAAANAECAKMPGADERFTKTVEVMTKFAAENAATDAAESVAGQLRGLAIQLSLGGSQLHQTGRYAEACVYLKRARLLLPKDPGVAYNLACAQARSGEKDLALKTLTESVELGFNDEAHLKKDPDLDSLREAEEYKKVIEKLAALPPDKKKPEPFGP